MADEGSTTRERIAAAALDLVNRGGLAALSMRRLAAALDVTPPVVYRYFADKDAVVDAMVEYLLRGEALPGVEEVGWRAWLRATFLHSRRELTRHAGALPALEGTEAFRVHAVALADQILGILLAAGLSPTEAADAFRALMNYTVGGTLIERATARTLDGIPVEAFEAHPHVLACGLALIPSDEQFERGLDAVLDQIATTAGE